MGRVFLEHMGGSRIYNCHSCLAYLTNRENLVSMRFTGATGAAYLFRKVVNVKYNQMQEREMLTGHHVVRDVLCKNCDTILGWFYEFASDDAQRYKEGHTILEKALIEESQGLPGDDHCPVTADEQ